MLAPWDIALPAWGLLLLAELELPKIQLPAWEEPPILELTACLFFIKYMTACLELLTALEVMLMAWGEALPACREMALTLKNLFLLGLIIPH